MNSTTSTLSAALKWPSIVIGSIVIGCAVVDDTFLIWPLLMGAGILAAIAALEYFRQTRRQLSTARSSDSGAVQPKGAGSVDYRILEPAPDSRVVVGEFHGGDLRDPVTVASLAAVLDQSKEMREPGWDGVCESIVETIARTGDARFLPALGRVRLARGSEFRDRVDSAIATIICKQGCASSVSLAD